MPITQRFVLSLPNIDATNSNEIQIFNRYISLIPSSYSPTAVARSVVIKQGATNILRVVAASSSKFKAPVLILEGEDGDFFTVKNTNVSNDRQKVEFVIEADFIRRRASHVGRKLTATVIDNGMSAEGVVSIN
ncbi:MAG: hypothetical protein JKY04_05245 [Sneathiella sp.]|nr:hypothetical protein [Sneathiella sp.]